MPEVMNELTLKQYFPVHVLEYNIDEELAKELRDVITPMIKNYKPTLSKKTYKTDYGEPVSILKEASLKSKCIEQVTDKLIELGNVYIQAMGLEEKERHFSAWINSYKGKEYQPIQHQCKNMFDISGVYCVDNVPNASLTIHNPSPFLQGTTVSSEHNYSKAILKFVMGKIYMFPSWLNHEISATDSFNPLVTMHFNFDQNTYLGFKPIEEDSTKGTGRNIGSAGKQRKERQKPYSGNIPKGRY